jgi:hypothetical protein
VRVSSDLPQVHVVIARVRHERVERGEANALIVSGVFLRRGKLRVVSADRAASTNTLVEDVVFGVDVVFRSATVGEESIEWVCVCHKISSHERRFPASISVPARRAKRHILTQTRRFGFGC